MQETCSRHQRVDPAGVKMITLFTALILVRARLEMDSKAGLNTYPNNKTAQPTYYI